MSEADDHTLAGRAAEEAGELLMRLRRERAADEPAVLRAAGDTESNTLLLALLAAERPDDAVLSEESVDDPVRLQSDRVWIIDPLDGTREFGELDRADWAVHVALWEQGELAAGAVALPAQGVTLRTGPGGQEPVSATTGRPPVVVVSRTRPPALSVAMAERLGGTLLEMGSAGAKVASVVQGLADIYVHGGGQYEWDSAAPVAVARQAGLHTSRLDGSPLRYNQPDSRLPDLVVCRPDLAERVLALAAEITAELESGEGLRA